MYAATALALLAAASIVVSAPAPAPGMTTGDHGASAGQHQQRRVSRQVPGLDILGDITQKVQQKMQRFTDFLSSLGLQVPVPNVNVPSGISNMAQDAAAED